MFCIRFRGVPAAHNKKIDQHSLIRIGSALCWCSRLVQERSQLAKVKLFLILSKNKYTTQDHNRMVESTTNAIIQDIMYIYNTVSDAQVGFLKGDIHADFIFKLNKFLEAKNSL